MNIGLFIPCYINQFYPQVGIATLQLLRQFGTVSYPSNQTCCGQPMANSGCEKEGLGAIKVFTNNFNAFDYVVAPSASCILHIREHGKELWPPAEEVAKRSYDLTEFLVDVVGIEKLQARFPHKVVLHKSCHGLRGMRLGTSSERVCQASSKQQMLLNLVDELETVQAQRTDECCGFGGTFSISEPEVSARMGKDRIEDYMRSGAEYITSGDMSCLMHLEGLITRKNWNIKVIHLAEILAAQGA